MTQPFKALCSYAYYRRGDMAKLATELGQPPPMLFGDSGAHSARTLGIHLTLQDYAEWCRRWDSVLTVYANLDVIGAPEATYANQKTLECMGLRPIPVFHTGTPWRWLHQYLDEGYTYLALGKLLGNPVKHVMPWLAKAFQLANGRAVFHGFGMTVWPALREFPFYSVDSSTWGAAARYGRVALFDQGRFISVRLRDRASVLRHRDLIQAHGADPTVLARRDAYNRATVLAVAATAYRRAERYLRQRHGPVTVAPGPHDPVRRTLGRDSPHGLHVYLAETEPRNLRMGADSMAVERGERV